MKPVYPVRPRARHRNAELFFADLIGAPPARRVRRVARGSPTPPARPPISERPSRYPAAVAPLPRVTPGRDDEASNDSQEAVPLGGHGPSASESVYAPPAARPYTPSSDRSIFRTPPDPVAVTAATDWPDATGDADGASERALRARGLTAEQIREFGTAGVAALRPIASVFGEVALAQLFQRLRYRPAQFVRPPHSYERQADLTRAFGREIARPVVLAVRTLLAIPGHFRELARRAGTEEEAYALEILGWLLMHSLAVDVRTKSGLDFWLPASPAFVTRFPTGVSGLSGQTTQLIRARALTEGNVDAAAYRARFTTWQSGAAGRHWRLETGRETSPGRPPGAPFYADPFTITPSINITAERAQVRAAWARRVADVDAGRTTVPLTQCDNAYVTRLGLMGPISLRGLQLRTRFPATASERPLRALTGLAATQPAFEAAFRAIADLGWNDLVFETQGMGCFRGKKIPGHPTAARTMSEHSMGIAVDLNVFENAQSTAGSLDPRIVALFEAFRFRWGKGFPTPDPMHFEYAG